MKIANCLLQSVSPYTQGRRIQSPRLDKEGADDHDKRCWRERLHSNSDGNIIIPPNVFKNCLSDCAKYLSKQIPGKGKATYTKHFEAGVMVAEPLVLPIKVEDCAYADVDVPADGRRGGTKRVLRRFPLIHGWGGIVQFLVLDETITEDVFKYHLEEAGKFIGIGVYRPRNNGYYGRFRVDSVEWKDFS